MTVVARAVLAELRAHGCHVQPEGEHLRIRGPVSQLPQELVERVRASKRDLLRLLTFPPSPTGTTPSAAVWARYFARFPAELARLAAAADHGGLSARHRPAGANTTAYHWARWFAAHPDELVAAGQQPTTGDLQ